MKLNLSNRLGSMTFYRKSGSAQSAILQLLTLSEPPDVIYDPTDATSLWVARDGSGANAAATDLVGFMADHAQLGGLTVAEYMAANAISDPNNLPGTHAIAITDAARPSLGANGRLTLDGVGRRMNPTPAFDIGSSGAFVGLLKVGGASGSRPYGLSQEYRNALRGYTNKWGAYADSGSLAFPLADDTDEEHILGDRWTDDVSDNRTLWFNGSEGGTITKFALGSDAASGLALFVQFNTGVQTAGSFVGEVGPLCFWDGAPAKATIVAASAILAELIS